MLASAHLKLGNYGTAIDILEDVVGVKSGVLDDHDSSLLASQYILGRAYLLDSQPEKGLNLILPVAAREAETLGPEHPSRLRTLLWLAKSYSDMGQPSRAVEIMEFVVGIRSRISAPNDQQRYESEYDLIMYLTNANRAQEARVLYDRFTENAAMLPEGHQRALRELEPRIATCYRDNGHLESAITMLEGMVRIGSETLLPDDPLRHIPEYNLIVFYIEAYRAQDARLLFESVMETAELLSEADQRVLKDLSEKHGLRRQVSLQSNRLIRSENDRSCKLFEDEQRGLTDKTEKDGVRRQASKQLSRLLRSFGSNVIDQAGLKT